MESVLLRSGLANLAGRLVRGRALVLAYHNVVPHGAPPVGEHALHLPQRCFADQLDRLAEVADVVPLADLFAAPGSHRRPRAVITFDDAYAGALTVGALELRQRRLPATIFVPPGLLGGRSFWWDDVIPRGATSLPPKLREALIEECAGRDDRVRAHEAQPADASSMPSWARSATTAELREAAQAGGITLGAHAWQHPNLAALAEEELDAELARPLAWLRETFPKCVLPWLSYPYGRHSDRVREAARAAGYAGAFRIEGGWLPADAQPGFALPRLNVPAGLSAKGFALRLAGLLCR
jgi:peptidoglycan/xylan/chitin deacetylase (PgdA/CDA1 family)